MTQEEAKEFIARYQQGRCTPEEKALVDAWLDEAGLSSDRPEVGGAELARKREAVFASLQQSLFHDRTRDATVRPIRRTGIWYWSAAAAAILLIAAFSFYFYQSQPSGGWQTIAASEVAPGGNRAVLTLADGSTISLDSTQSGIIIGGSDITYLDGSTSVAMLSGVEASPTIETLTLTTPLGGQYQIMLSDGTNVWLNANSTLRYPVKFTGEERVVELIGEAYFEVRNTRDEIPAYRTGRRGTKSVPFKVKSAGQIVEVLGTQFNISAYPDQREIKTTLVEGEVQVESSAGARVSLMPNEQSTLIGATITKQQADIASIIAWKKGYFHFSEDMESLLRQVSRWYDVEVVFADASLKGEQIFGIANRSKSLEVVLKMLEETSDAKFSVTTNGKERRVTVMR